VRQFFVELGAKLQELWAELMRHGERLLWKIGHDWGDQWFVVLIVVALGAALWSLRAGHLGRTGK
jgi:hypothetical protein